MKAQFVDKPAGFPTTQVNGQPLKPVTQALLDRRATSHFKPDPIPVEYLEAILKFGAQAPSGFNLQPWRFIVVRDKTNRQRLQKAAMNQPKVGEAPVVIIAFAVKDQWRKQMEPILNEGARRGAGKPEDVPKIEKMITGFLDDFPASIWLNRHTMIAVTTMMIVAEAYGLDTAPMEGFDPAAVKAEFGLPEGSEVICLLAMGFAAEPDKAYGGRLDLSRIVFEEEINRPWSGRTTSEEIPTEIAPSSSGSLQPI